MTSTTAGVLAEEVLTALVEVSDDAILVCDRGWLVAWGRQVVWA
jgi:hypothetical protein